MANILSVREYEIITYNENFKSVPGYQYLDEKHFRELEHFIKEYSTQTDDADILEFMKVGYKRNIGDTISLNSSVGIIELPSGFQIEILPKIDFDTEDGNTIETKKVFLKMLKSLKDFQYKSFSSASLNADRMNMYEIFINMYIAETRNLVKHGLKSSYIQQEDNLKYFKGKLQVSQHIKYNAVHKERFYMQYDEYHIDRSENRLVKSTLLKLQKLTHSSENTKAINQLLDSFEMITPSDNYEKDFSKLENSRATKDYELLMHWSRIFLMNKSFTTFSGKSSGKALLFPMEQVFEAYIAKWVKKVFETNTNSTASVTAQDGGYYLFDEPKKFKLRPDIVVRDTGKKIIMDTKWKRLNSNPQKNYGISQSDMYQMYAYSKKYETSEICLLYPYNDEVAGLDEISFLADDENVRVRVFFVDLSKDIEEEINRLYLMYYK